MATSDTKSGQLDNNDIIFPAPGGGFTRADEYDLDTTAIGQSVTLSLTAKPDNNFDPYLQVINSATGEVVADSDDSTVTNTNSVISPLQEQKPDGPGADDPQIKNDLVILGGVKYKVRVTSFEPLPAQPTTHPYELQVSIPQGNVSLVPRGSTFSGTALKGSAVTLTGKLDGSKDFTFPAPGGGFTLADEFLVNTSLDGKLLDISLSSTTVGFNPYVEVVDAITGQVVKFADGGGGKNALLTGVLHPANADYRIRVTSNTPFPTATVPDYKLQVTVNQGEVTLTPRSGDTPILQQNTGPGPVNTGPGPVNTGPGPVNTGSDLLVFPPVTIVTPTINAPGPGNPTGQSANTVSGLFYNLSDRNDDILLFSLPSTATGKQILALSGSDNIIGTSGADTINGMQGADTIDGGAGNDSLSGGKESDSLEGGAGNDDILGNNDNDTLTGGEGNDTIRGGKEKDSLTGGAGDDFLYGDRNQDFLTGGDGNDTFVLAGGQIAATISTDADVITDFKTGDKIGLTDGNTFAKLTFEDVSLTLNGQSAVNSIAIKADSNYLGIVQGVARADLTANAFVIL